MAKRTKRVWCQSEREGYLFRQFERELRRVIGDANYCELEQRYPEYP